MNKNTKNPFTTPEGYFDSFKDRLMANLANNESELPSKQGFKVPDNYFENLKINLEPKEVKVIKLNPIKKIITLAVSAAAIAIIYLGFNLNSTKDVSFSSLANIDIEAYFDNQEFDLSTYDIAEVLPLGEMEIADIIDHEIKDENIIDYLNENLDDFEELNLQDNE